MGAKQSKRSVDISGKEAEGGGEVAAAGAGGEGRVEPIADADALKPQLNGDAHIHTPTTDKEKELDIGTPENEKDATTEKEGKEDEEKATTPVTNGEAEPTVENGDSTPTPEDGKKPKKEKVKKKWSLRSISFSRKDKPKQEKKPKEDEPKTNGEPEKVVEETAETSPEATVNEVAEEAKVSIEEKDEKTPETPVTEPLTNGSSTPDSVKVETPVTEEAAPSSPAEPLAEEKPEPTPEPKPEPEQLPINGLSLEETKSEMPAVEKPDEIKPEPPVTETAEIAPVPEIPKEVCVKQMPLLEPTPPPLPANPPPSVVASFAASTMAPELPAAALAPLSAPSGTAHALDAPLAPSAPLVATVILENKLSAPLKETEDTPVIEESVSENEADATVAVDEIESIKVYKTPVVDVEPVKLETSTENIIANESLPEPAQESLPEPGVEIQNETLEESVKVGAVNGVPSPVSSDAAAVEVESPTVVSTSEAQPTITDTPALDITVASSKVENSVVKESEAEPSVINVSENEATVPITSECMTIVSNDISSEIDEPVTKTKEVEKAPEVEATMSASVTSTTVEVPQTNGVQCKTESLEEATEEPSIPARSPLEPVASEATPEEAADIPDPLDIPEPETYTQESSEASSLPPPPIEDEDDVTNLDADENESLPQIPEPLAARTEQLTNGVAGAEDATPADVTCNGDALQHEAEQRAALHSPQEPLPVSDKLADLIPDIPEVPELKTETLQESSTEVAVGN